MRSLLFLFFLALPHTFFSQWKSIGSASGFPATETAVEITPGGQLYLAGLNPENNNRFFVRKWVNDNWETVGTSDFSNGGYFGLQLVAVGENTVYVAAKRVNGSDELIEIYKYTTGGAWIQQTIGQPIQTSHTYDFSLQVTPDDVPILTYYNKSTGFDYLSVIAVNLNTDQQLLSYTPALLTGVGNALSSQVTSTSDITIVLEQNALLELTSSLPLIHYNGSSPTNYSVAPDNALSLKTAKSGSLLSTIWLTDAFNPELKFRAMNGTTFGSAMTLLQSSGIASYDLDMQNNRAFLFYRDGGNCVFAQIASTMTPSLSTITSGTALAPPTATSLSTDTYNDIHVIAYVDNNRCYVREYDKPAGIVSYEPFTMCEGSSFDNNGNTAVYCYDPNFDHSNLSMTCASQNTTVLPQSAVSVSGSGLNWNLGIATTNDIAATTVSDLKWTLHENGIATEDMLTPVRIYSNPAIQFHFAETAFCENDKNVVLTGKATPYGGNWSGTGVVGNYFKPEEFEPVQSTQSYLYYTTTNPYGCTSTDSIQVTIFQSPDLVTSTTASDCAISNGSASVAISGGAPSYTTYWSNGDVATSIDHLSAGSYQVYVTDAMGCFSKAIATVESNTFTTTSAVTTVSCNDGHNGAIDLTIANGTGPFSFNWSNGAETEDISGLTAGSYEVTVSDAAGCISSVVFTVTEPETLALSVANTSSPACGENDGSVAVNALGGTEPYSYDWRNADNESIGDNAVLSEIAAGFYTCQLTDDAGCTTSLPVAVSNENSPEVVIGAVTSSSCDNDGSIQLIDISGAVTAFQWSNGSNGPTADALAPGLYTVNASDANGCLTVLSATILPTLPETPAICLVTADTLTNSSRVIWNKPETDAISHYNIYRQVGGFYQLAGSVEYASDAVFNDEAGSAEDHSQRYRITAVNLCDVESEQSIPHKSLHLTANDGLGDDVNLSWSAYEGLNYPGFIVRRHTDLDGWQTLQTMPANLYTYTDQPPTHDGLIYVIAIELPESCGEESFILSNKDTQLATVLSVDELSDGKLRLFPNPSEGKIQVENASDQVLEAIVHDAFGRVVTRFSVAPGTTQTDLGFLSDGLYQLVFPTEKDIFVQKLIIRH